MPYDDEVFGKYITAKYAMVTKKLDISLIPELKFFNTTQCSYDLLGIPSKGKEFLKI